jgi:hypothetical protein
MGRMVSNILLEGGCFSEPDSSALARKYQRHHTGLRGIGALLLAPVLLAATLRFSILGAMAHADYGGGGPIFNTDPYSVVGYLFPLDSGEYVALTPDDTQLYMGCNDIVPGLATVSVLIPREEP